MHRAVVYFSALALAAGISALLCVADSSDAGCGLATAAAPQPNESGACTFSQTGGQRLAQGAIAFTVHATDEGSINHMSVAVTGLELGDQQFDQEIDGSAYRVQVADLDADGWPEIYIFIKSAGSGSYGSVVAYAVNNGKSVTPIYLPPLEQQPAASVGYMGHDDFAVVENRLVRRFPVYREGDSNSAPGGGTRQLQYRLVPGEAGWILESERVVEN